MRTVHSGAAGACLRPDTGAGAVRASDARAAPPATPSDERPQSASPPGLARRSERLAGGHPTSASRAPRAGSVAAVSADMPLSPAQIQPGDVLFYQRPASKPKPKLLSAYTGIVAGQAALKRAMPDYFEGGSAKTVHCSVCVGNSVSGDIQIAEASETRGVGTRPLPPGDYIVYRPRNGAVAQENAQLMNGWATSDTAPRYSGKKAFLGGLKTRLSGQRPDELPRRQANGPNIDAHGAAETAYPSPTTFCSEMVANAVGRSARHTETGRRLRLTPERTVPAGLQAQLERGENYQRIGKFQRQPEQAGTSADTAVLPLIDHDRFGRPGGIDAAAPHVDWDRHGRGLADAHTQAQASQQRDAAAADALYGDQVLNDIDGRR
jgi:hypothetical protein